MRIPDYRNVHGVKDLNHWTTKISRVDKAHEDEFAKELEGSIHKRKSETKKFKKPCQTLAPKEPLIETNSHKNIPIPMTINSPFENDVLMAR